MCCLFGFYNYSGEPIKNISALTNSLARQAIVRGTDASGIAYNHNGKLIIHKESRSAALIDFKHPDNIVSMLGHTRHSTQGSHKRNHNNHPFSGQCQNRGFALAHNGVLINDRELQKKLKLPKSKIETDSYVAVQLIEKKNVLSAESIKYMAEQVEGSFSFSILDTKDTLWLIKGDSPLSIIHLPDYRLYVYASTDEILYKSLVDTKLFDAVKKGRFEELAIKDGEIISILPNGQIKRSEFKHDIYGYSGRFNWWEYGITSKKERTAYIDDLKSVAVYHGYTADDIDNLLSNGFTVEEIEEYIYCCE